MRARSSMVLLVAGLGACGGAVAGDPSDADGGASAEQRAHAATGLWIARSPFDDARFSVLEICAGGALGHALPTGGLGASPACAVRSGSFHEAAGTIVLDEGSSRREAKLDGDTLVIVEGGQEIYLRATPVKTMGGSYVMHAVVGQAGDDRVTISRQLRVEGGSCRFDNALTREGTGERWTTVDEGACDVVMPGIVEMTASGATRRLHAVVFGARGEYLHIETVGFLSRTGG